MSSDRTPSKSEVMGWSPQQLADYLRRMNLSGCDKVVLKNSINGPRFVNLSENDLQKFPKLHAPMISKISSEIGKKEGKSLFPFGKKQTTYHAPDTGPDVQGWGEDEFDEEFDEDYESPYSGDEDGSGGDYESPNDDDYEPPPSEPPDDLPHKFHPTMPIGDGEYIDNRDNHAASMAPPPAPCPRPPVSTPSTLSMPREPASRRDPSPHSGGRPSAKFPSAPPISRINKPGRDSNAHMRGPPGTADKSGGQSRRSDFPAPPTIAKPPVLPPSNTSVSRSNSSVRPSPNRFDGWRDQPHDDASKSSTFPLPNKSLPPRPGIPGPPSRHGDSLPSNVSGSLPHKMPSGMADDKRSDRQSFRPPPPTTGYTQGLDPRWYVGKVTRGQAEGCLKRVCKDGAYLVRDSTRQLANQPFTLMVLYQDKVYNIQIRQQNQQFQLGTGLKAQESFPSVTDIICHYSQSPLLLIDAKNRGSGQQNQCMLSDPAAYYMSGQNWS